jgi:hypothetical protein
MAMSRKFLACFFIILFSKVLFGNPQDSVQQGFVAKTERFLKNRLKGVSGIWKWTVLQSAKIGYWRILSYWRANRVPFCAKVSIR